MKTLYLLLSILLSTSIYSQSCLVAQYDFDGNGNDVSGNGHHGTVSGAALTVDRFSRNNQAYDFDGNNDEITVPDHIDLDGFSEMTMVVWVKMASYDYDGSEKVIVQKWGTGPSVNRAYSLVFDSLGNYLRFRIGINQFIYVL